MGTAAPSACLFCASWCFRAGERVEKTNRLLGLPAAPKRRISSLSRARARLIDRATYVDMCRDTYRKSCTHTAQPCSPSGRCASTTGTALNEPPGTPGPFFPSLRISLRFRDRLPSHRPSTSVAFCLTNRWQLGRSSANGFLLSSRNCFVKQSVCCLLSR